MCGHYPALLHELDAEIWQLVPSSPRGFYVSQMRFLVNTQLLASPAAKTVPDHEGETDFQSVAFMAEEEQFLETTLAKA